MMADPTDLCSREAGQQCKLTSISHRAQRNLENGIPRPGLAILPAGSSKTGPVREHLS